VPHALILLVDVKVHVPSIDHVNHAAESPANEVAEHAKLRLILSHAAQGLHRGHLADLGDLSGVEGEAAVAVATENDHLGVAQREACARFGRHEVRVVHFQLGPLLLGDHRPVGCASLIALIQGVGPSIEDVDGNDVAHLALSILARHHVDVPLAHHDRCCVDRIGRQRRYVEPVISMSIIRLTSLGRARSTGLTAKSEDEAVADQSEGRSEPGRLHHLSIVGVDVAVDLDR